MTDIQKQLDYWMSVADDDIITADLLIEKKRNRYGLFLCHLMIEKALKAHYEKNKKEIAPKTLNLIYLSEKAELQFDNDTQIFLGILMKYQLEGRYPDYSPIYPDQQMVDEYLIKTKELLQWLKQKL